MVAQLAQQKPERTYLRLLEETLSFEKPNNWLAETLPKAFPNGALDLAWRERVVTIRAKHLYLMVLY
jgi:hypothetical protein